jgi:hypothetical protein
VTAIVQEGYYTVLEVGKSHALNDCGGIPDICHAVRTSLQLHTNGQMYWTSIHCDFHYHILLNNRCRVLALNELKILVFLQLVPSGCETYSPPCQTNTGLHLQRRDVDNPPASAAKVRDG